MKLLLTSLLILVATTMTANASETFTKEISAKTQLYTGSVTDVAIYIDLELKEGAIKACGSAENIVGLKEYKINISLAGAGSSNSGPSTISLNLKSDNNYEAPLAYGVAYPAGSATAIVECKN